MRNACCFLFLIAGGMAHAEEMTNNASPYPHEYAKYHWSYKCGVARTAGLTHGCRVSINGIVYGDVQKFSVITIQDDKIQGFYYAIQSFDALGGGSISTEGVSEANLSFSVTGIYSILSDGPGDLPRAK